MEYKARLLVRSAIAVTVLVACYVGMTSFSLETDIPAQNEETSTDVNLSQPSGRLALAQLPELDDQKTVVQRAEHSQTERLEPVPTMAKEIVETVLAELKYKLKTSEESLRHPIMGPSNTNHELRTQLLLAIEQDPSLVDELMIEFFNEPNSLLGRELSLVLSQSALPKAQHAALDLAFDLSQTDEDRAAGLILVSNMAQIDGNTRDRILAHIESRSEVTSDMQQFSLMALRPSPSSEEDYRRVHEILNESMQTEDSDVRRHSVYQLAQWANKDSDLTPVRQSALHDPDINTRARAIMSIADSSIQSDKNRHVLWQVSNNIDEPSELRMYALKSLSSYTLSNNELSNLSALMRQIETNSN
ncbi:hypothetical protein L1286_22655 [Pseudoalteromonas sp. SMS1]|uniref:HEAT repeat domain-containing protein n=1 Tax=Pseudoalteromonas sp. SMS1 TaxID=2908894 RepID=UPI001F2DBE20|nr:HEAT repeat domain-containing protein [Pseudoalteromonas sp. SMS1]MCF2860287.1 hypothetical protein [Pseudoalteromonas sp. SMS1]